ncbi:arginase family protein [Streptomyces sp. NPDC057474]|uniref:arginase family protein n=1 Tax=Streptomyces sp. NPDC057474 TaxID=3346144 RepID=UPI0036ADD19C
MVQEDEGLEGVTRVLTSRLVEVRSEDLVHRVVEDHLSWTEDDFPNAEKWGISTFSPADLRSTSDALLEWLASTGCTRVAVHLDVDVVDSDEVLLGLGAEPGGLTSAQVRRLITDIGEAAEVVGFTIAEYIPRQVMAVRRLVEGLPLL